MLHNNTIRILNPIISVCFSGPGDFLAVSTLLTYMPGSAQVIQCVSVVTITDTVLENAETLSVFFTSMDPDVMSESAVVSIVDNDGQ